MSPLLHLSSPVCLAVFLSLFCKKILLIFGIFSTVFSVFLVFFASYHFVSHPKNSVSLQSETSETNLFFRYFASLIFAFVSLPSEMMGHPNLNPYFLYPSSSESLQSRIPPVPNPSRIPPFTVSLQFYSYINPFFPASLLSGSVSFYENISTKVVIVTVIISNYSSSAHEKKHAASAKHSTTAHVNRAGRASSK